MRLQYFRNLPQQRDRLRIVFHGALDKTDLFRTRLAPFGIIVFDCQRNRLVQRLVFAAVRLFDRRQYLVIDTGVRIGLKCGLFVRIVAADRLENPDHALLHNILVVSPGNVVSLRLIFGEAFVFFDQQFLRSLAALLRHLNKLFVRQNMQIIHAADPSVV